jgi:hypothetical protein
MKTCKMCGKEHNKPRSEFCSDSCYKKMWRGCNTARNKTVCRDWYKHNKAHSKNTRLKRSYGITLQMYSEMLKVQNYQCAICGKHQSECAYGLRVDHNHNTTMVRELLCNECNTGIGFLKESEEILLSAIEYLKRHNQGSDK